MSEPRKYIPDAVKRAKEAESMQTKSAQADIQFDPSPFPVDALNQTQRNIVEAVADVHQLPIELAAMPAIAVIAAAMGKSWKLTGAVNGCANFANLYIIPGAPKSTGKGAAAQLATPLIESSQKLIENWVNQEKPCLESDRQILDAQSRHLISCFVHRKDGKRPLSGTELAALEDELKEVNAKLERIKPLLAATPSYHVGNATSEALAMKFARNDDTLFALAYEGGDVLRVMLGKYSKGDNADFDLWLSGYSVEPYNSDRILRGNVNITPCLTALIFCQPSLLRELYGNEEAFDRGLTARVLPFICEPELKEDDGIVKSVSVFYRDAWHGLIVRLLDARKKQSKVGEPIIIQCDAGAREVFRAFHNESIRLRNGPFRDIAGELGRWRENACRIALGLCIADDPAATTLTEQQAIRAVTIARWCQYSALGVMHSGRMERRLARVTKLRDLVQGHGGQATLSELEKRHCFHPEEVDRLALEFPELLRIESRQNPKGGPQSRVLLACKVGI